MGWFSSGQVIGSYLLEFPSTDMAAVTDRIPDGGESLLGPVPYFMSFAFAYAAKLLGNMPSDRGQAVVQRANARWRSKIEALDAEWTQLLEGAENELKVPDAYTFLGTFSDQPIRLIAPPVEARWSYSGELVRMSNGFLIAKTKIAMGGDPEQLHCAAIDVAFETARLRCGDRGGAIVFGAGAFLKNLAIHDSVDVTGNTRRAGTMASAAATMLSSGKMGS